MYEVTLSIQRLVNKYGNELWDPTWSIILDILEEIITHTGKIYLNIFNLNLLKANSNYNCVRVCAYAWREREGEGVTL